MGLIKALVCPHYDTEPDRKKFLKKMLKKEKIFAFALDNGAALAVIDNKFKILISKRGANGYKAYWQEGRYYEEKIKKWL